MIKDSGEQKSKDLTQTPSHRGGRFSSPGSPACRDGEGFEYCIGAVMNKGWIKLHREMKGSKVWYYTHGQFRVWMTILMSVNWTESWARFNGDEVKLEPGQMVTSRSHLVEESRTSKSVVRDTLTKLEKDEMINMERSSEGTLLTVLNWGEYQQTVKTGSSDKDNDAGMEEGNEEGKEGGTHEEGQEAEELKDKKHKKADDEPEEEVDLFKKRQGKIVEMLESLGLPHFDDKNLWGLAGRWIKNYGSRPTIMVIEDLKHSGKLAPDQFDERSEPIRFISACIKNEHQFNGAGWYDLDLIPDDPDENVHDNLLDYDCAHPWMADDMDTRAKWFQDRRAQKEHGEIR